MWEASSRTQKHGFAVTNPVFSFPSRTSGRWGSFFDSKIGKATQSVPKFPNFEPSSAFEKKTNAATFLERSKPHQIPFHE